MNETNIPPQTQTQPSGDKGSVLHQLEMWLDKYLGQKAPQIPPGGREAIVKIVPWVTLIILILALPVLLALFGLGALLTPFAFLGGLHTGTMYIVTWALTLVIFVFEIIALPGLFHRQRKGWQFLFYASLVTAVLNILSISVGGLVGTVIGLYILFQIRSYYK